MGTAPVRELVRFHRRAELPGIEIRDVNDSDRVWRWFSTGFEFVVPHSWCGDVFHRRRQATLRPGMVLCAHPGDVFSMLPVHQGGSGSAVIIAPELFYDRLAAYVPSPRRVQLRGIAPASHRLASSFAALCDAVRSPMATSPRLRASVDGFVGAIAAELLDAGPPPQAELSPQAELAPPAELSRTMGLSRFQVLRAFKRRYGLSPHLYQLRVRIGLAQKALAAGQKPADVAAEYGFVDQSHFTRHFKRLVGVTPARYAMSAR